MKKLGLAFLFVLLLGKADAQESIMPDISYPFLEKLIETAKQNYPKAKMFEAKRQQFQTQLTRSKFSYFDLFTFSYLYSPNNSINIVNPRLLNGYQLGVYANLGSLVQKPFNVRVARQELKYAEYDQQAYILNLEAEVEQRYIGYIKEVSLLRIRYQNLEDATSMLREVKTKFEKGMESLEVYSRIQLIYGDRMQDKINTEASVLIAKSKLEELLGVKLEEVK